MRLLAMLLIVALPQVQNPDLQRALTAYDGLDYDKAGQLLDRVLQGTDLSDSDRTTALFYSGIVSFDLNDTSKAHDAFLQALKRDPSLALGPDAAPKLRDFFASVKKEVPAQPETSDVPAAKPTPAPPDDEQAAPSKPAAGGLDSDAEATDQKPITSRPVFWVGVGAAAVAVGVVVFLLARGGSNCQASSSQGCVDVHVQQQGLAQW